MSAQCTALTRQLQTPRSRWVCQAQYPAAAVNGACVVAAADGGGGGGGEL